MWGWGVGDLYYHSYFDKYQMNQTKIDLITCSSGHQICYPTQDIQEHHHQAPNVPTAALPHHAGTVICRNLSTVPAVFPAAIQL